MCSKTPREHGEVGRGSSAGYSRGTSRTRQARQNSCPTFVDRLDPHDSAGTVLHGRSEIDQRITARTPILTSRLAHSRTRLGVYEVTAQIGEGGMGQVYRATDTKLKRQVAIKILPPSLAADHDRLARFQREAEVLASLNHPNIAAHLRPRRERRRARALVMELVEGEDLSQRIARRRDPARRGAADCEADRRGARSRARAGDHPSRSEAGEYQGRAGRHRQSARLRPGQGDRVQSARRAPSAIAIADHHGPR